MDKGCAIDSWQLIFEKCGREAMRRAWSFVHHHR